MRCLPCCVDKTANQQRKGRQEEVYSAHL
jgi:hypothetical protein